MTPFQQFIQDLPHGQYATFRNLVRIEMLKADLGISDQTFRNWERGCCEPDDETKRAVINQCAEAITGKTIY